MIDSVYAVPPRSAVQRMEALRRANAVRSHRRALKADLKAWRGRGLAEVVLDPQELEGTMAVFELLLAAPRIGRVKAMKILNRARVSPSKTLAGLSERQRRELVVILRRR